MQSPQPVTETEPEVQDGPTPMSLAEFLEGVPPNQFIPIIQLARKEDYRISTPEIRLHCADESCNGDRFFRYVGQNPPPLLNRDGDTLIHLHYRCSNCRRGRKIFSLWARLIHADDGECYKLGELPVYGPRPRRN